jgi:hypothetical protein
MAVNSFINNILTALSIPFPRLEEPLNQLHILTEMMNPKAFSLINYFLMLAPEYRYNWQLIIQREIETSYLEIDKLPQFQILRSYMVSKGLLTEYEAEFLDDAIHEVLVN